jgi:hypothetical protein
MFSLTREYDAAIIPLFHATGDFKYRSSWQEGVRAVEGLSHFLPRLGMRTRFVLDSGESVIYASSYTFSPERIEFSETDEAKKVSMNFILETVSETKTNLTINYYIRKNSFDELFFKISKKARLRNKWRRSMEQLQELVRDIKLP